MKHLNEATIQAFLDAELTEEAMERATQHFAVCESCTKILIKAEAELTEINFAFSAQVSSPVPSQRIWARIENEIDFLGASNGNPIKAETKSFWQQWATFLSPAQIAFAGGLAAVVLISLFALQVLQQTVSQTDYIAAHNSNSNSKISNTEPTENAVIFPTPSVEEPTLVKLPLTSPRLNKVLYQPKKVNRPEAQNPKPKTQNPKSLDVLPEEHDYLNSIAQLSKAVETSDEFVMRPSFRVDYERNLAVMDGAISAMQKQVRRNPKDENAKRILFASYENKIELLNTVAEKSQMIASLR
ncbi:MAG: hypothetical protein ABI954_10655 [Pyrinomonadaceae bacterium]